MEKFTEIYGNPRVRAARAPKFSADRYFGVPVPKSTRLATKISGDLLSSIFSHARAHKVTNSTGRDRYFFLMRFLPWSPQKDPQGPKNGLGRRASRFCTICDENQLLKKKQLWQL
jgi:hypothetical protein